MSLLQPDYFSIKQLCERWKLDLNQIQDILFNNSTPLHACLAGKISAKREDEIIRLENEKSRYCGSSKNLADRVIKLEQNRIREKKEHLLFEKKCLGSGDSCIDAYDFIAYDEKYVELLENKSILGRLFSGKKILINKVKVKREGCLCFIKDGCYITLADIYICREYIYKVENFNTKEKEIEKQKNDDFVLSRTKQERYSGLKNRIKELFKQNSSIKNKDMWNKFKEEISISGLIRKMTSWSDYDAHIIWVSQNEIEQKMTIKSFRNTMSVLRSLKNIPANIPTS